MKSNEAAGSRCAAQRCENVLENLFENGSAASKLALVELIVCVDYELCLQPLSCDTKQVYLQSSQKLSKIVYALLKNKDKGFWALMMERFYTSESCHSVCATLKTVEKELWLNTLKESPEAISSYIQHLFIVLF